MRLGKKGVKENGNKLCDQTTDELWSVIESAHKRGLNYWQILGILLCELAGQLQVKAEAEYYVKGGK